MKILVLNGSPKKKSDTFRLTEAFLRGMNRRAEHETHIVRVIDTKISPCRGCFSCWRRGDGRCVIDDDQNAILDVYRDADVIIWSFPLYCYGMPSHLKAVLDRTIPLVQQKMVRLPDGAVRHESLVDFSRIHTLVISGCGFPHWEGNFDGLRQMCRTCFGSPTMICVPETPLLNVPAAKAVADPLLARFERAGEEYAASLALSPDTIAALEAPMIPADTCSDSGPIYPATRPPSSPGAKMKPLSEGGARTVFPPIPSRRRIWTGITGTWLNPASFTHLPPLTTPVPSAI